VLDKKIKIKSVKERNKNKKILNSDWMD